VVGASGTKVVSSDVEVPPVKPPKVPTKGKMTVPHASVEGSLQKLPLLAAVLTDSHVDGTYEPRSGAAYTVKTFGGGWQLTLREPNVGLMISVHCQTHDELWPAMELLLKVPEPPWKYDEYASVNKKSRR
jgi:hypothetical protein